MGVIVLSDSAICMCPHGGRLQFFVTHRKADGADTQVLPLADYSSAFIIGCVLPPPAGPCLKVLTAVDPLGEAMKIDGKSVTTQSVISLTDKGWPIMVVYPGRSAVAVDPVPALPSTMPSTSFAHEAVARKKSVTGVVVTKSAPLAKAAPQSSSTTAVLTGAAANLPRNVIPTLSPEERKKIETVQAFKTKGVSLMDAKRYLLTPEGRDVVRAFRHADPKASSYTVMRRALKAVHSGTEPPKAKPVAKGSKLYKLMPDRTAAGGAEEPSSYTPFFCTEDDLALAQQSGKPISDFFGLPAKNDSASFNIFEMEALKDTTVLESTVAPTEELGFKLAGGATQQIVPNRRLFSKPKFVRSFPDNAV